MSRILYNAAANGVPSLSIDIYQRLCRLQFFKLFLSISDISSLFWTICQRQFEKEQSKRYCGLKITHPVKYVSPSLKGDTLEDREHGKTKVVKVGDAKVGTFPKLSADMSSLCVTLVVASAKRWIVLINHFP